jgi:hypothetical protein
MTRVATLALTVLASSPAFAPAVDLIVKQGRTRATVEIVDALVAQAPKDSAPQVVDLSGDWNTDFARVSRAASDGSNLFAVGPGATVLCASLAETKAARVISLAVPNPERLKAAATYVSFYPRLDAVFRFLAGRFHAHNIGLLYSPSQNETVATAFADAARARGLSLQGIPVRSPGDLVRHLRSGLEGVDVLLVPVDPLVFDRQSLQIVVDEAKAAAKPAIGFLPDLAELGLAGSIVTSRESQAKAAWLASRRAKSAAVDVDGLFYVSQGTTTAVDAESEKTIEQKPRK